MSESESDKQALAHWVFTVSHLLQCGLFIVNLLVFGHVCFIAEVVKIASISLGVELWDKGSTLGSKSAPINLGEVWVVVDILDG